MNNEKLCAVGPDVGCRDDLNVLVSHDDIVYGALVDEEPTFYNPELWRTSYSPMPYPLNNINFDAAEQAMIREINRKTGCPSSNIVRVAVRYYYERVMNGGVVDDSKECAVEV